MKYLMLILLLAFGVTTMAQDGGTVTQAEFDSATLGRPYRYSIYLPSSYGDGAVYPVIYLLHGRGDDMSAWLNIKTTLDTMIAEGRVPPMIAVMPDFPSSQRGGYYVDSLYTGAPAGEAIETAFFNDLIPHIDATYSTSAGRTARLVGGYSMGGYGALRYALAHPEMFVGALVLSPAVYIPLPPVDSSTREFGAFGIGDALFDEARYTALNYPALLPQFAQTALGLSMFIAVGDDEWKNERPEDVLHDLDVEAHMVFNQVARVPSIRSEFRVYDGGHDWDVWRRGFEEGLPFLARQIHITGVGDAGMNPSNIGGLGLDIIDSGGADFAGGAVNTADGSNIVALAVSAPFAGLPHAGELDTVVVKRTTGGAVTWAQALATPANDRPYGVALDADENVIVAGYTSGNLDGKHSGAASDDAFVAKYDADGNHLWTLQFGDEVHADRIYGLTVAPDGDIYVTGYTKGFLAVETVGDKDVFLARVSADGEFVWLGQFGGVGEDKAYSIAVDGNRVAIAGVYMTDGGGLDAFVAAYSTAGERLWFQTFGTPGWDEAQGVAFGADGTVYVAGFAAGVIGAHDFLGDKDIVVAAFSPDGTLIASDQTGTEGNDKGAVIRVTDAGEVIVGAFTDTGFEGTTNGGFDIVVLRYDASLSLTSATQYGTASDDGADEWAENNLFLSIAGERLLFSGLTGEDVFVLPME